MSACMYFMYFSKLLISSWTNVGSGVFGLGNSISYNLYKKTSWICFLLSATDFFKSTLFYLYISWISLIYASAYLFSFPLQLSSSSVSNVSYAKSTHTENTSLQWYCFSNVHYISLPSIVAIFFITYLVVVMQPSGYSVFYSGNTSIWLGFLWQSYTLISVSTLKPLLGVIGAILLKLQASPILSLVYKTSSYTVIH